MSNKELIDSLTSDMNAGVRRIYNNSAIIQDLSYQELCQLSEKIERYRPTTEAGGERQRIILKIIAAMTEIAAPAVNSIVSAETATKIAESSFVLELHTREPSFTQKVDAKDYNVIMKDDSGVATDRLSISKKLILKRDIQQLGRHRHYFIKSLKNMSLPGGLLTLGNGQFLIPLTMLPRVREKIAGYLSKRDELLDDFEARYTEIIASARERLGGLFDTSDYPPFSMIRERYCTDYKFISNRVPEEFKKVSEEIYSAEKQRILAECAGTVGLVENALRNKFIELTEHFAERLGSDSEGKPKKFQGSTLDHLKEFIEIFSEMNLTGDGELADLVKVTEKLVEGADIKKIRTDKQFRADLEKGFEKIKLASDRLVITRKRKVVLED